MSGRSIWEELSIRLLVTTGVSIWDLLLIVVFATIVANGFIAWKKGRSVVGWVILGLMFNPIAFVVLLFLPSLRWDAEDSVAARRLEERAAGPTGERRT